MELNIDTFGELMDKHLKDTSWLMMVASEAGEEDVKLKDSIGGGPVLQLYILGLALRHSIKELFSMKQLELDLEKKEMFLDAILDMIRDDVLKAQ